MVNFPDIDDHFPSYDDSFDVKSWDYMLSPGQKQKIVFARMLHRKPRIAVLDECTSAVDVKSEECMYAACRDLGIQLWSVTHGERLERWHQVKLVLKGDGDGGWYMEKIQQKDV